MSTGFFINICPTTGAFFNNSYSNDTLIFTQSNSQKIIMGINSNSIGNIVLSSNLTTINTNFTNIGTLSNNGQAYFANNLGIYNPTPQYALDVTGDINFNGQFIYNGNIIANNITYQTGGIFGTSTIPINGGNILLDTNISLSAIIELGTGSGSLNINLSQLYTSQVGNIGNIMIIERNTVGRSLTLDPRIQFPTYANGIATGFSNNGFYYSTLTNFTTSAPPAAGGIAVDIITYNISNIGFGLGKYSRTFRCMPPAFTTIPAQTGIRTPTNPYTLNLTNYFSTYSSYYGSLTYSITGSPAIPITMSIGQNNGIITINQSTDYTGNVTVSITGIAGTTTVPITFGVSST